jgi:hypothetical protein
LPENHPGGRIALASEMEAPNPGVPATLVRLGAYGKAGFRKIDPAAVPFLQPDFRDPGLIERDGEKPIPLQLVVRFCPEETEAIDGATVREIVTASAPSRLIGFTPESYKIGFCWQAPVMKKAVMAPRIAPRARTQIASIVIILSDGEHAPPRPRAEMVQSWSQLCFNAER